MNVVAGKVVEIENEFESLWLLAGKQKKSFGVESFVKFEGFGEVVEDYVYFAGSERVAIVTGAHCHQTVLSLTEVRLMKQKLKQQLLPIVSADVLVGIFPMNSEHLRQKSTAREWNHNGPHLICQYLSTLRKKRRKKKPPLFVMETPTKSDSY